MSVDYNALGSRIKKARKDRNLTQEDLAEYTDLSTTHISNIENGNSVLSVKTLVDIANALSITTDPLLCDSLDQSINNYKIEFQTILDECTIDEARILTDNAKNTLATLRKHYKQR